MHPHRTTHRLTLRHLPLAPPERLFLGLGAQQQLALLEHGVAQLALALTRRTQLTQQRGALACLQRETLEQETRGAADLLQCALWGCASFGVTVKGEDVSCESNCVG